ncbi:MAG: response regulator [Comamonas sp.]
MTKLMILIADDHADSADALGLVMEMDFPKSLVAVTYGAREALERGSRQRPDVALLDMEMPEMDGEALARALRVLYPGQAPLLIALSGNLPLLEEARGNGVFDCCMSKPIDVDALVRMVEKRLAAIEAGPAGAL